MQFGNYIAKNNRIYKITEYKDNEPKALQFLTVIPKTIKNMKQLEDYIYNNFMDKQAPNFIKVFNK